MAQTTVFCLSGCKTNVYHIFFLFVCNRLLVYVLLDVKVNKKNKKLIDSYVSKDKEAQKKLGEK